MVTAALGGTVEVPTIGGEKTKVKIPEGTQSGKRLRLPGAGCPCCARAPSVTCMCRWWWKRRRTSHKRQKELLAEFEGLSSTDTHSESNGFFAKMKDFFQGASSDND